MATSILYVGVDVDDKAFHLAGYDEQQDVYYEYKCKPTHGALEDKLEAMIERGYTLKICYEASYIGYSLYRVLTKSGYDCEIIAPSHIPTQSSSRVKTDKIDSRKLALFYAKGLLTPIAIPDKVDESLRRMIRSRSFQVSERKKLKLHILSNCRQLGLSYREEMGKERHYWTKKHLLWLATQIKKLPEEEQWLFEKLLYNLHHANEFIKQFDERIELIAMSDRYRKRCEALNAFKGLSTLSSMTLIGELGDIRRFSHPKKIVSYAGMDISEYSSGGKEKKYGITKMGDKHVRTTLVEACQTISSGTVVGKQLRARRKSIPPEIVSIAERCQNRLHKKRMKLMMRNKAPNKIKMACAREMIGFIWEALHLVA